MNISMGQQAKDALAPLSKDCCIGISNVLGPNKIGISHDNLLDFLLKNYRELSIDECNLYNSANLDYIVKPNEVDLISTDIEYDYKDGLGMTNVERMRQGLPPIDAQSGIPFHIHEVFPEAKEKLIAELKYNQYMEFLDILENGIHGTNLQNIVAEKSNCEYWINRTTSISDLENKIQTSFDNINVHRGKIVPGVSENSLEAIAKTAESPVSGVEYDVRVSKDGHLFLHHDQEVDGLKISDLSSSELDARNMARFEDAFEICVNKGKEQIIEIKDGTSKFTDIEDIENGKYAADKICNKIIDSKVEKQTTVACFNEDILNYIHEKYPDIQTRLFIGKSNSSLYLKDGRISTLPGSKYELCINSITSVGIKDTIIINNKGIVDYFHSKNIKVDAWTITDQKQLTQVNALGVDSVTAELDGIPKIPDSELDVSDLKNWNNMSITERKECIYNTHQTLVHYLKIPSSELVFRDLPAYTKGEYSPLGKIVINKSLLYDNSIPPSFLSTIAHETYHSYQKYCVLHPEVHSDPAEVKDWAENFETYFDAESFGYEAYYFQPLEVSARDFADKIVAHSEHVFDSPKGMIV